MPGLTRRELETGIRTTLNGHEGGNPGYSQEIDLTVYRASSRPYVRPAKAGLFSGSQSRQGKRQSPLAWMTGTRETYYLKLIDKAILGIVSELPGRNVSECIGSLEMRKSRGRTLNIGVKAACMGEKCLKRSSTLAG